MASKVKRESCSFYNCPLHNTPSFLKAGAKSTKRKISNSSTASPSAFGSTIVGPPTACLKNGACCICDGAIRRRHPRVARVAAVDKLDVCLATIFRLRFRQDCVRLLSARIHHIAKNWIPPMIASLFAFSGPGWFAANIFREESGIKDVFRHCLLMDLREMDDRVWTSSAEWTYTAIRFMLHQEGYTIPEGGIPASDLILFLPLLQRMANELQSSPKPVCSPLGHFPPLTLSDTDLLNQMSHAMSETKRKLQQQQQQQSSEKSKKVNDNSNNNNKTIQDITSDPSWENGKIKLEYGLRYGVDALWDVVSEFDVAAFGQGVELAFNIKGSGLKGWETVLRYEPIVHEEDEQRNSYGNGSHQNNKINNNSGNGNKKGALRSAHKGKIPAKYWDGRGGGINDWGTSNEEDVWSRDLDSYAPDQDDIFPGSSPSHPASYSYQKAERHRERGNAAFNSGDYVTAVSEYTHAHKYEARLPVYLLNRAMANLRLKRYDEAENDCSMALSRHLASSKGLWRRARVRRIIGTRENDPVKLLEAEQDILTLLVFHPDNTEARSELISLREQIGRPGFPAESSTSQLRPRSEVLRYYIDYYHRLNKDSFFSPINPNCTPSSSSSSSSSSTTASSSTSSSPFYSDNTKNLISKSQGRHRLSLQGHHLLTSPESILTNVPPLQKRTKFPPPFEFTSLDNRRLHFSCDVRQKDGITFQIRKLDK